MGCGLGPVAARPSRVAPWISSTRPRPGCLRHAGTAWTGTRAGLVAPPRADDLSSSEVLHTIGLVRRATGLFGPRLPPLGADALGGGVTLQPSRLLLEQLWRLD
jgi:hypothetical protein